MSNVTTEQVIGQACRLPLEAKAQLLQRLLTDLRLRLSRGSDDRPQGDARNLEPLTNMTRDELQAVAAAMIPVPHQRKLSSLLAKNRGDVLSEGEERELDTLLAETERVTRLKARALYTLAKESGDFTD